MDALSRTIHRVAAYAKGDNAMIMTHEIIYVLPNDKTGEGYYTGSSMLGAHVSSERQDAMDFADTRVDGMRMQAHLSLLDREGIPYMIGSFLPGVSFYNPQLTVEYQNYVRIYNEMKAGDSQ